MQFPLLHPMFASVERAPLHAHPRRLWFRELPIRSRRFGPRHLLTWPLGDVSTPSCRVGPGVSACDDSHQIRGAAASAGAVARGYGLACPRCRRFHPAVRAICRSTFKPECPGFSIWRSSATRVSDERDADIQTSFPPQPESLRQITVHGFVPALPPVSIHRVVTISLEPEARLCQN